MRDASTIRREVKRLFLALTRIVIDPLLLSQAPGAVLLDLTASQVAAVD